MGLACWWLTRSGQWVAEAAVGGGEKVLMLGIGVALSVLFYLGVSRLLGSEELNYLIQLRRSKKE